MKLTGEEVKLVSKSRKVHEDLLDAIIKNGIPTDIEQQGVLVKVLGSLDKNIASIARLRLDDEANKNMSDVKDMIASVIMEHKSRRSTAMPLDVLPSLPDTVIRKNPVNGELDQGIVKSSYKEFTDALNASL